MSRNLLSGLRVIESSAFVAAPLCGLTLAQFGAQVIRVDMIGGGIDYSRMPLAPSGRSFYWTGLNRQKRSLAVDLSRPEGRELVAELASAPGEDGGVLLTNIPARWLSHDSLAARRPDMITCTIEGNSDGTTAVDYTVNCATGYPAITGPGSRERPVNHAFPAWDVACALQAATAIASAVLRRRATGEGAELRIALSDVAFATISSLGLVAEAELTGEDRASTGNDIYGAFGRDFPTGDGQRVMVAAISRKQWTSLVSACGIGEAIAALETALGSDFGRESERFEHRDIIAALVRRWTQARSLEEIGRVFQEAGVCWGPYRTVRELLAHDPRVAPEAGLFRTIDTPGIGAHRAAGSPVRLAGAEPDAIRPAAYLGADTDAVLADILKLSAAQIARLHDAGIVAGPDRDPTVRPV